MNRTTWTAALALVAVAAVYVIFIRKTDEDRIRAQLKALCEAVHEDEGENELLRAARIEKAFPHLFTKEVDLHIPEIREGRRPRSELATLAVGAGHMATKIELRFSDLRIEIDRPMQRSWAMATATAVGTLRNGGGHMESRAVVMRFDKEEEEWRIANIALPDAEQP